MHVPPPDPGADFLLSRRLFLGSCSVLALALGACRSVGPRAGFAARMITDPADREYRPVLSGLMRALLPFEDPRFPATFERIERRLLDLFPIDDGAQFLALQRGLTFFDEVTLFPHLLGPLVRRERQVRSREGDVADPAVAWGERRAALGAEEERLYRRFRASIDGSPRRFTELPLDQQRAYVRMWSASVFTTKRQFARSAKSIVMITAYSTEELWQAIGYGGPVLEEGRATP